MLENKKQDVELESQGEDQITKAIGAIGRWQIWICCIVFLVKFPVAWHQMSIIFLAPPMNFTCSVNDQFDNHCEANCTSYKYDHNVFGETIVSQWNLVCEREWLKNATQTIFMLGILVGSMLFGYLSDRFGRRAPFLAAVFLQLISGVATAYSVNWYMFTALRFILAVATGGTMVTSFVLTMELIGTRFRATVGILYQIPFNFGHLLLPFFGYFFRNWSHFQLAISMPSILFMSYYYLLPESPRWLLTVGRVDDAVKIMETAAKRNGRATEGIRSSIQKMMAGSTKDTKEHSFIDLFRTPRLRSRTIAICFNWFVCGFCFFGVSQYIGHFSGNIFSNVAISAAILVPGTLISIYANKVLGRKITLISSNCVTGLSCLLINVVPKTESSHLLLGCIGLWGMSISFATVYLYAGELFPTVVRNSGVGLSSTVARIGSMLAPFVATLAHKSAWFPPIAFGVVPLIGSCLCILLPDTRVIRVRSWKPINIRVKYLVMANDDSIETVIGRFGRYQIWIFFLITVGRLPAEYQLTNVVFLTPNAEYVCNDIGVNYTANYCPCDNPVYDISIMRSASSDWNLICDRRQLASFAQSMLQVGVLIGSLFYGYIADRYGRKIANVLSLVTEVIFVAMSAAATELWMFAVCRFLIGTGVGGTMLCCYVIIIELSGKSFRPYLTGLIEISYISAYMSMPAIAYFLEDWRHLQLATSIPFSFSIFYYWLIPESPRWLITMGKKKEAVQLLTYISKKNNMTVENIDAIVEKAHEESQQQRKQNYASYFDLFKTPKIRLYTIITAFVWLCCSHSFFGINQYIGRLQGNIYINVVLSAATLIPAMIYVVFASLYMRRKVAIIASFVVTAVSLLFFLVVPKSMESITLALAIIGQTGAYTAFVQTYLFTSEIFPTVLRNSAMGFGSVFARFGGFIAPFVVNVGIEWVSISVFSIIALIAGCLCFFLPETKGIVLLNTINQTEK
ncbi:unnamed protein product [Leptidea sinapis]|uniref:Major facilitator superfamily (MFS) profile domain-containing protein n=1 Tax=Leptidea sinapis TaxID=189913 RepID=A0A5E4QS15_9NEOP|nr:unnamed protein product [Leptidea sinapis]